MDDDDWGMNSAEETKLGKEQEKVEKKQEKQEKQGQSKDQDESSWFGEKRKEQPSPREGRGRNAGRAELKQAVVQEKAVELKPDEKQESFWGEDKKEKQKSVEKPRQAEERGRGRGNRDGQEQGQRGGRNYERNYRNNDQGEGDRRGNRDGNNEWRGNRGGYNNDRGGRNFGDRGSQRPERGGERGGERGQYRGRGRGGYNGGGFNRNFQNSQEQNVQQQAVQQKKSEVAIPKARKCWPECNIHIFGIKLCITFRRIQDFKCKLLVVPFKTPKLEFYPGNLVNQSQVNYKEKIAKKEELKQGGETYFQKAQKIADFEAVAFLKIDDFTLKESLSKGIKQVFERVEGIDEANLQSVVFSFCDELGDPRHSIQQVIKGLQETKKIKYFYINTISQDCFLECVRAFMEEMKFLFEENEVSIE